MSKEIQEIDMLISTISKDLDDAIQNMDTEVLAIAVLLSQIVELLRLKYRRDKILMAISTVSMSNLIGYLEEVKQIIKENDRSLYSNSSYVL